MFPTLAMAIEAIFFSVLLACRESEGSFMYGNYRREAEDLRAVVQHFCKQERLISAIIGHSKGLCNIE